MDISAGLVVIGLGAAFAALVLITRTGSRLDSFASGFLPYGSAGWPRGVQEEEPVRWSWSRPGGPSPTEGSRSGTRTDPEVVELTGRDAPSASQVRRGPTVRRAARRVKPTW